MLQFFHHSPDISYHVLWDVPVTQVKPSERAYIQPMQSLPTPTILISNLNTADTNGQGHIEIDHTSDPNFELARDMAKSTCCDSNVNPHSWVFLRVGYCSKAHYKFLHCFRGGSS